MTGSVGNKVYYDVPQSSIPPETKNNFLTQIPDQLFFNAIAQLPVFQFPQPLRVQRPLVDSFEEDSIHSNSSLQVSFDSTTEPPSSELDEISMDTDEMDFFT